MPVFKYLASDNQGKIHSSQMEAVDRQTVIGYLKDEKLLVISVKEEEKTALSRNLFGGKVSIVDKINLTGNLSIMLKAGVGMPEAVNVIGEDSKNAYFKQVLQDVHYGLENGKSLSAGLSPYNKDFDEVFINLVKAGEASGKLEKSLMELNVQLKKDYALISKIRGALAYPAVLVGGMIFVSILLMIFVLPRLVTIFNASNLKLPLTTRIVFFISTVLSYKPVLTIAGLIILVFVAILLSRLKKVKTLANRILLHIPVSADLLRHLELVRFCRTLGNLLKAGVSIIPSLEITAHSMTLPKFSHMILNAKEEIAKGISLSNAFKDEKNFPSLVVSVIRVGEKTGELDALLLNLADFYEEQTDNTLKSLSSLIEPILLVIVGLGIGGMALSIILPIYQLIGSF